MDADSISHAMPISPDRVCRIGDPKRTPSGKQLSGHYDRTHWHAKLETPADGDVSDFLRSLHKQLENAHGFLRGVADTGGTSEVFIGLFADRCCDFELPVSLLGDLASSGLGLRFDYYGPGNSPPEI